MLLPQWQIWSIIDRSKENPIPSTFLTAANTRNITNAIIYSIIAKTNALLDIEATLRAFPSSISASLLWHLSGVWLVYHSPLEPATQVTSFLS